MVAHFSQMYFAIYQNPIPPKGTRYVRVKLGLAAPDVKEKLVLEDRWTLGPRALITKQYLLFSRKLDLEDKLLFQGCSLNYVIVLPTSLGLLKIFW